MRGLRVIWLCLVVAWAMSASVPAQSPRCDGPSDDAEIFSVEAYTPQQAAQGFLELEFAASPAWTASDLARTLLEKARGVEQSPDPGTIGPLYGFKPWGRENGYVFRKLCGDDYYLEKETDAGNGYSVVFYVVVSSTRWSVVSISRSSGLTLMRSPGGDVWLDVLLVLRQKGASAPAYETDLRRQYSSQAAQIQQDIYTYCAAYKTAYASELRALAGTLQQPERSPGSRAPAADLAVSIKVPGHLAVTTPLDLSTADVSLLVVTGTVVDDRGAAVGGAEIALVGTDSAARTAGDGTYRMSAFGSGTTLVLRRADIRLQRATLELSIRSTDGAPVLGVAADGVSRLTLDVTSYGIRSDTVAVTPPALGEFERPASGGPPLTLDKNGKGTLVYVPPKAVPTEALTDVLAIGKGSPARVVPAAPVSFTVRYVDLDGTSKTASIAVRVCRPPVLLIQSQFGGTTATWTRFADHAKSFKLDCQVSGEGVTWSPGNVSLSEWAKDVALRITEARAAYETSGIRIAAVDVVAHSLAGLAVRSLLESASPRQDVHRLILVGTPNHGIAWLDQDIAAPAVRWLDAHPIAAGEVIENSSFLRGLNPTRIADRRVEAVNLIGSRPSPTLASRPNGYVAPDDGIVSGGSAYLNGVHNVRVDGVVHAPGLLTDAPGLTESPDVWSRLVGFLTGTISAAESDTVLCSLRAAKQVSVSMDPKAAPWAVVSRLPMSLVSGVALRTGDKGSASLTVVRSGQTWGQITLDAGTEVILHASSPTLVRLEVVSGRIRLRAGDGTAPDKGFEIVLAKSLRDAKWYLAQPEARVTGSGGDLAVAREETHTVLALSGQVVVEPARDAGFFPAQLVDGGSGVRIRTDGRVESEAVPARGWWTTRSWASGGGVPVFPLPLMGVCLLGLAVALVYHVRARRALAARSGRNGSSSGQSP